MRFMMLLKATCHGVGRAAAKTSIKGKYNEELVKVPESIARMEHDFKASRGETKG